MALMNVPSALACLYWIAECAAMTGMKDITFQSVAKLQADFQDMAGLLAMSSSVLVLRSGPALDFARLAPTSVRRSVIRLCRSLLSGYQSRQHATLGDLLRREVPADPMMRTAFLREVSRLAPRLVERGAGKQSRTKNTLLQRTAGAIQRYVLGAASDDFVQQTYDHLHARLSHKTSAPSANEVEEPAQSY